jgi:hypothetical protein
MRLAGHIERMGELRNAYKILVRREERQDNIKLDVKEMWHESVDWIHLSQDGVQR